MDGVFIRFLNKLGITDLSPFSDCLLSKCDFKKDINMLVVEIKAKNILKYEHYKAIFDGLEKCDYKTQLTFIYENEIDKNKLFDLLKD